MKSTRLETALRAALALLLACAACSPPARAQTPAPPQGGPAAAAAAPRVRLVAALENYEGPSAFNGRPALAAFSPDGRTVAISGEGRAVRLFESATGSPLFTLAGEKMGFNGFSFSSDSRLAAARATLDRSVTLWDVATRTRLHRLGGRERDLETKIKATMVPSLEFFEVPFSPDGRAVLTEVEDDVVVAWDVAEGRRLYALHHRTETNAGKDLFGMAFGKLNPLLMSAAYSPDGARIVTANGDALPKLWDAAKGQLAAELSGPGQRVYFAAFLPAAGAVLTVSLKGRVSLWDAAAGAHLVDLVAEQDDYKLMAVERGGGPVAFSRDGRWVAARDDNGVKVWDLSVAGGGQSVTIKQNRSRRLVFSPDGRTLATAGDDKRAAARLWDSATGGPKLALGSPDGETRYVAFSPDGRLLLTAGDKGVRLWDAETGAPVATLERSRPPARFSPDGTRLVTGGTGKTAYLYELGRDR